MKITYGRPRRFVPVCHRTEFGFMGGPIRYEENYDRRNSVIVVDMRETREESSEKDKQCE